MIYLLPVGEWDATARIFAFDASTSEARVDSHKWTKHALESGAEVNNFAVKEPRKYDVAGVVVASLATSDGEVTTRVPDIHRALAEYADTHQPVTLVTGMWSEDVVIAKVTAKRDVKTGEALDISISLETYEIATYTDIEVPADLLAQGVKDSGSDDGDGGEGATIEDEEAFDPSAKTAAAAAVDGDNPWEIISAGANTLGGG